MLRLLCFSARNCGRLCSSARSRFIEGNPPRTQEPPLPLPGMPAVIRIIEESATRLWQGGVLRGAARVSNLAPLRIPRTDLSASSSYSSTGQ